MRIVAFSDWYLPGFRAGGPVRTLANLVERLGDRLEFRIVTRDRDLDGVPYRGLAPEQWHVVGRGSVLYLRPEGMGSDCLAAIVRDTNPDLLYVNSVFSPFARRVLAARRSGRLGGVPILLAPRGQFARAALAHKGVRKRIYLALARARGLYRDIVWQASSPFERDDILRVAGPNADVGVVADVASPLPEIDPSWRPPKAPGALRLAFLGRIAGMKNPVYLVERLAALRGEVVLDFWGPIEEPALRSACEAAARRLPAGITIAFKGEIDASDVTAMLAGYHAFALPTLGENFGHVILEALSAGCPVVVSDRTPWRGLAAKGAGSDLPLEDPQAWERTLQGLIDLDAAGWLRRAETARAFAASWIEAEDLTPAIALFERAARMKV